MDEYLETLSSYVDAEKDIVLRSQDINNRRIVCVTNRDVDDQLIDVVIEGKEVKIEYLQLSYLIEAVNNVDQNIISIVGELPYKLLRNLISSDRFLLRFHKLTSIWPISRFLETVIIGLYRLMSAINTTFGMKVTPPAMQDFDNSVIRLWSKLDDAEPMNNEERYERLYLKFAPRIRLSNAMNGLLLNALLDRSVEDVFGVLNNKRSLTVQMAIYQAYMTFISSKLLLENRSIPYDFGQLSVPFDDAIKGGAGLNRKVVERLFFITKDNVEAEIDWFNSEFMKSIRKENERYFLTKSLMYVLRKHIPSVLEQSGSAHNKLVKSIEIPHDMASMKNLMLEIGFDHEDLKVFNGEAIVSSSLFIARSVSLGMIHRYSDLDFIALVEQIPDFSGKGIVEFAPGFIEMNESYKNGHLFCMKYVSSHFLGDTEAWLIELNELVQQLKEELIELEHAEKALTKINQYKSRQRYSDRKEELLYDLNMGALLNNGSGDGEGLTQVDRQLRDTSAFIECRAFSDFLEFSVISLSIFTHGSRLLSPFDAREVILSLVHFVFSMKGAPLYSIKWMFEFTHKHPKLNEVAVKYVLPSCDQVEMSKIKMEIKEVIDSEVKECFEKSLLIGLYSR